VELAPQRELTSESEPDPDQERVAGVVRRILLGELSAQQACDQEGISPDELTDWIRVHRRAVRRGIDEQIAAALSEQGLDREDFVLAGNLQNMTLSDLLETIQLGGKHAHIRIEHDGKYSHLWCVDGEVIDAQAGALVGTPALFRLLSLREGRLQAEFSPVERAHTILASTRELLVEFARRSDELVRLRDRVGDTTRVLLPNASDAVRAELDPQQRDVLRAFDGIRSIEAVIEVRARPELETLIAIARLVERQCLISAPPPEEPVSTGSPRTPPSMQRAAQTGYASLAPSSQAAVSQVPVSQVPASRVSVPPIAPSVQISSSVPPIARRYAPFAVVGACLLLAFAVGLWTARPPAARPELQVLTRQPAAGEDVGSAVCGPGMALFTSGSAGPASALRAGARPFCLAQRPVTTDEYESCVNSQRCEAAQTDGAAEEPAGDHESLRCNAGQAGRERSPINCVTQRQAEQYCEWRGQRLPLPDEWEAAWRSVHGRAAASVAGAVASRDPGSSSTRLGDLSEWTKDRTDRAQRGAGPGSEQQLYAVLRVDTSAGGAPSESTPNRLYTTANAHGRGIGFRCALSVETSAALSRLE
jgi:hypothetical protein